MQSKPYTKYKPSSVEWLGDVPEHWEVKKLKQTMSLITKKSNAETQNVALENIESWSGKYIPSDTEFDGDGVTFQVGDILFGKLRPYLAKAYLAEFHGAAVGDFHVMRPIMMHLHGRYILYLILNKEVISLIDGSTFGAKMPRVNWEFMANIPIPLPTLPEQQAIATFLYRETGHIDALIAKKKKLLSLLAEQRTALISRAVTKGLNPSVKLKPSGVEWLGDVPEHWAMKKILFLLHRLQDGTHFSPESDYSGEYLYITAKNIKGNGIDLSDITFVTKEAHEEIYKRCPVKKGDVLYIKDGATAGIATVNNLEKEFSMLSSVAMLRPKPLALDSKFLTYHLNNQAFKKFVLNSLVGGAMTRFTIEIISKFRLITPPLPEQQAIADFLDCETAKIDALSAKVQTAIERLREYRTALISAAVTGKIDVREAV